jgi:hypothetical protein
MEKILFVIIFVIERLEKIHVMETEKELKTFICVACKQKDCDIYTDKHGTQIIYVGVEKINNTHYHQTKCKECILKDDVQIFVKT